MQNLEASYDEGEHAVKRYKVLQAANLPVQSGTSLIQIEEYVSDNSNQEVDDLEEEEEPQQQEINDAQPSTSTATDSDQNPESSEHFDIFEELLKLYKEERKSKGFEDKEEDEEEEEEEEESEDESEKDDSDKEVDPELDPEHVSEPFLLDKLVNEKKLNTVIFNLYSGNKGYSIALRAQDRAMCIKEGIEEKLMETQKWQYEEREMLSYLDREEIPAFLMETLDQYGFYFYSGCVIAEVRDYRQNYPLNKCNIHHILLRHRQQHIFTDVYNFSKDLPDLTTEDKNELESQITMLHAPEMYLEPDLHIENRLAKLHNKRHFWNRHGFRKIAEKFSQNAVNRKRKLIQHAERHSLDLFEFAKAKKRRYETQSLPSTSTSTRSILHRKISLPEENKTVLPIANLDCRSITMPNQSISINNCKTINWPDSTCDCSPVLLNEYILESDTPSTDSDKSRVYHIKLSISQRKSNLECVGVLYLDRDHKESEDNGVSCRFTLGSTLNAQRYVEQFTEIFTESGRKIVRIKYGRPETTRSVLQSSISSFRSSNSCGGGSSSGSMGSGGSTTTIPQPREQLQKLTQALQAQHNQQISYPNGIRQHSLPTAQLLQQVVQATRQKAQQKTTSELLGIKAITADIRDYAEQFEANAKQQAAQKQQQQQQQRLSANSTIINSLNSSPICSLNSEATAVVVNTLNGTTAPAHQRIFSGKIANTANLSRLNPKLLKAVSPRILSTVNSNMSIAGDNNKSSLSALLVGTPAADRPDIASSPNTNSLLLEKLAGTTVPNAFNTHSMATKGSTTPQTQYVVQGPKGNFVISPQPSSNSLSLAQFQAIPGLQNVKVQLPNSNQRISLNMLNVSGQVSSGAGGHAGLLVSLPAGATSTSQNQGSVVTVQASHQQQQQQSTVQGVVLNAGGNTQQLAQLTNSGNIRSIAPQNLRLANRSQTIQLRQQGNAQFPVFSQLQRQTRQQQQQNIISLPISSTSRTATIQRNPITIKMTPNSNQRLNTNSNVQQQPQQYQQQHLMQNSQLLHAMQQGKIVYENFQNMGNDQY